MSRKRRSSFPLELIIFLILFVVLWRVVAVHAVHRHLYSYLANQRGGLYTTLLTVEATLLGFIVAILAIVLGYAQASRFEIVRRSRHWTGLFSAYTRAVRWSACATALFLVGLLGDRDSSPHPVVAALCMAGLLMSAAALAWMLWVTERVVWVVVTPAGRKPGE
jgi:hypothetical protein